MQRESSEQGEPTTVSPNPRASRQEKVTGIADPLGTPRARRIDIRWGRFAIALFALRAIGCAAPHEEVNSVAQANGVAPPTTSTTNLAATTTSTPVLGLPLPSFTAYQGYNNHLWISGGDTGLGMDTELGMMAGTNPAAVQIANGSYVVAFEANTGILWVLTATTGSTNTVIAPTNTGVAMMPCTSPTTPCASPAITAIASGVGYVVAYEATNGHLWTYGANTGDSDDGMMAGTSPAIATLANGGFQIAFHEPGGNLYMAGANAHGNTGLGMIPGTSPSITGVPYGVGFTVAYQGTNGHLWMHGANSGDTGDGMLAGTSPAIVTLAGGQLEIAIQEIAGHLYLNGGATPNGNTGLAMMPGTSPSLAPLAGGGFVTLFHSASDVIGSLSSSSAGSAGLAFAQVATATSPVIAGPATLPTPSGFTGVTAPALAGTYTPYLPGQNPFVFTSQARMTALLQANTPASQSALAAIQVNVQADVNAWQAYVAAGPANPDAGSPTTAPDYLVPDNGSTISHTDTSDGHVCDNYCGQFMRGAGPMLADLATFVYLTRLGQGYGNPTLASQASALAIDVMSAWATRGFLRDSSNNLIQDSTKYLADNEFVAAENGLPDPNSVSLFLSLGMASWIQAEDLLVGAGALSATQQAMFDTFLVQMQGLIDNAIPHTFDPGALGGNPPPCRFGNQTSAHLRGLLAIAQFRRDQARIESIANGADGATLVPWNLQVQQNVYGPGSTLECMYGAEGPDGGIVTPAPGEIQDRNRPAAYQTLGYTTGSLEHLLWAGEILQNDGYAALTYTGGQQQSLQMAAKYYDYYFGAYASNVATTVPAEPTPLYPDYAWYVTKDTSTVSDDTITGADTYLDDWFMAERDFPGVAFNSLNRVKQFSTSSQPAFSRIPSVLLDRLVDPQISARWICAGVLAI